MAPLFYDPPETAQKTTPTFTLFPFFKIRQNQPMKRLQLLHCSQEKTPTFTLFHFFKTRQNQPKKRLQLLHGSPFLRCARTSQRKDKLLQKLNRCTRARPNTRKAPNRCTVCRTPQKWRPSFFGFPFTQPPKSAAFPLNNPQNARRGSSSWFRKADPTVSKVGFSSRPAAGYSG